MFPKKANDKLAQRKASGQIRQLKTYPPTAIDFFSNDYLGIARQLSQNEIVSTSKGATGSRLISGNTIQHQDLETYLAYFYNAPSALFFNSGYAANQGVLSSVPQKGDTILYDALAHASIRDGIRLSWAKSYSFRHNDWDDLQRKAQQAEGDVFVVTEGLFSMDGDIAPLKKMVEICDENGWFLILDEAHSTGIYGKTGKGFYETIDSSNIFARIHTFGKALGTHGAVVVGSEKLRKYLINFARTFIYTTAPPLEQLESVRQAHLLLEKSDDERGKLKNNIVYFSQKVDELNLENYFLSSNSPIQCLIYEQEKLVLIEKKLFQNNVIVKTVFPPTVPQGKERIRLVIHSFNTQNEIDLLLNWTKEEIEK